MSAPLIGTRVHVRGIVQGVGFRPFVYAAAKRCQLTGWVRNTTSGVEIHINGTQADIRMFLAELEQNAPPLARIDQITHQPCPPDDASEFVIIDSQSREGEFIPVPPDTSICPDCQRELFDPRDRRYRYPFINCTNCGPRFSIIQDIPYDRPKTTMSGFPLCSDCQQEYHDPADRRFHAQPVACPVCGPHIWFEAQGKTLGKHEEALQLARASLKAGKIIAIKGLGGFHLACDAANPLAVEELRRRKKRSDKPFALMAFNLATIQAHAVTSPAEEAILSSRQRPVVLLQRKPSSNIVPQVAPNQSTLGFMLPYTPLHFLLLEPASDFPSVLVMTSGNLSEEPIAYRDEEALQHLSGLCDGFLMHNRPIHMRVDDSVLCVQDDQPYFIRRSRGYAPESLPFVADAPSILAVGAELKNAFCLTRDNYAFLSHHIGDMENYETLQSFQEGIPHFEHLFHINPQIIACDMHPNYLATHYARQRSAAENIPLVEIQHHHAHLAACLAEHQYPLAQPAIGLCLDGTGYGTDGAIWGGEVLLGSCASYQRAYHLSYVPLPGGDLSIRKPARMALSWLWANGIPWESDLPPVQALCYEERTALRAQLEHRLNSPLTSSMGRLFDAISALIGVRQQATYEGQAAIELEAVADPQEKAAYEIDISGDVLNPAPMIQQIITDWKSSVSIPVLSARFHNSITQALLKACLAIRQTTEINVVALSGGVWQNRFLLQACTTRLRQAGFMVLTHRLTPTNDGCIALGQAAIAAAIYNANRN